MAHVLSLSYGKDSLACLEACKLLGYPIDRVIHAEVWATDTIPADLPPMVDFKKKADNIILERYGLVVEHITASTREREIVLRATVLHQAIPQETWYRMYLRIPYGARSMVQLSTQNATSQRIAKSGHTRRCSTTFLRGRTRPSKV